RKPHRERGQRHGEHRPSDRAAGAVRRHPQPLAGHLGQRAAVTRAGQGNGLRHGERQRAEHEVERPPASQPPRVTRRLVAGHRCCSRAAARSASSNSSQLASFGNDGGCRTPYTDPYATTTASATVVHSSWVTEPSASAVDSAPRPAMTAPRIALICSLIGTTGTFFRGRPAVGTGVLLIRWGENTNRRWVRPAGQWYRCHHRWRQLRTGRCPSDGTGQPAAPSLGSPCTTRSHQTTRHTALPGPKSGRGRSRSCPTP